MSVPSRRLERDASRRCLFATDTADDISAAGREEMQISAAARMYSISKRKANIGTSVSVIYDKLLLYIASSASVY